MLYHVHEKRYYGNYHGSHAGSGYGYQGGRGEYGGYESLHTLEHFQGLSGSEQLVHQEFEELHHFAPLARGNSLQASQSGTRLTTAVKKLSGLVRYVYLSLF